MRSQISLLKALQTSRFVNAIQNQNESLNIELLANGQKYSKQLENQWLMTKYDSFYLHNINDRIFKTDDDSFHKRFSFVDTPTFHENFQILQQQSLNDRWPAVLKNKQKFNNKVAVSNNTNINTNKKTSIFHHSTISNTLLISDFIVYPENSLEKFYNIQRERKIWWMRFSANPSRYFLEPYLLSEDEKKVINNSRQSITINARFSFGNETMEHITLMPLRSVNQINGIKFQLIDPRNKAHLIPTVIRSVINLELATCALLLDAFDHGRENILLLNRKLAPFQCAISCLNNENLYEDLKDLALHLSFVIQRAGLRLCENFEIFANTKELQKQQIDEADNIGIPYLLILEDITLQTGLLKLRNRDTSLEETIHISDIPNYLLNIFKN